VRLFVAVEVPAELRALLAERVERLREHLPRSSWVRAENLHLSLAFLGEVAANRVPDLERRLAEQIAGFPAFDAWTGAAGAFPERGPLRVIWIGLEPESALAELADAARGAIAAARVDLDDKPFRAHVTLARARTPWPPRWRERIAALAPARERFEVRSVSLVESVLGAGGARYRACAEIRLREVA